MDLHEHRVELQNISKSFGGISALKNVSLKVRPGEIHALIGENGAGKSTLMKVLSGAYSMDSGRILIDGSPVRIRNTHDSRKLGIGIIYQEFSLVPALSVAENVFLGQLNQGGVWIDWKTLKRKAASLINDLGFEIDPSREVGKLTVAHQQVVEIAKALSENVRILILDEPSAVLGTHEITRLFDTLIRLRESDVSIIYISHHIREVFQIADRITVLKDGSSGDPQPVSQTDEDAVIRQMLGRSLNTLYPARHPRHGNELLRVTGLSVKGKIERVDFSVKAGEILGFAGLVGSGRTETARAVFGADRRGTGRVFLSGRRLFLRSPADAAGAGIGMVPEDRQHQGIILSSSVMQNISLTDLSGISGPLGFINLRKERRIVRKLIKDLSIKTSGEKAIVYTLSGGNQQKVVLAKWLNSQCSVLFVDEPTRGVDIGGKVEIYKLINDLSLQGVAIVVISSETNELMGLCDRILVMRKGRIEGELPRQEFSEEKILRMSIGSSFKST